MLEDMQNKGSVVVMLLSIAAIFLSGIFFGITYFLMDTVDVALQDIDCEIPDNAYADNCQELLEISIYPFLALKSILVWFSYFFIFTLVIGMLVVGYNSGNSPAMMGLLLVVTLVMTYVGIEMSNIYRTLLENPTMLSMMTDFNIYNKVMLNFPLFIAIVGLASMALGIVNYQKARVNTPTSDLDY